MKKIFGVNAKRLGVTEERAEGILREWAEKRGFVPLAYIHKSGGLVLIRYEDGQ